jgi:hypothetical protein
MESPTPVRLNMNVPGMNSFMTSELSPRLSPRLAWPAGDYEGEVLNGLRHGHGTMEFRNGNTYTGEWVNDQFHGTGEYLWADGRVYKGQFKKDRIQGKGVAYWVDGRTYDGEWVADHGDGRGIFTLGDNRVFEGVFRRDFPIIGQMIESTGDTYLANFDGSTQASEWRPHKKSNVGVFQDGWRTASPPNWIREFEWEDGRRFAGCCVGYCPLSGVYLDGDGELKFVVYDGKLTFAEGPSPITERKLRWTSKVPF